MKEPESLHDFMAREYRKLARAQALLDFGREISKANSLTDLDAWVGAEYQKVMGPQGYTCSQCGLYSDTEDDGGHDCPGDGRE